MQSSLLYYVWLSLAFNPGSNKPYEALNTISPEKLYNMDSNELKKLNIFSEDEIKRMQSVEIGSAQKIIDDCKRLKINIASIDDEIYPLRLKHIYGPPIVLYYIGNISEIDDNVAIAIVGTRDSTAYTDKITQSLSHDLAKAGAIIVSGCAVGIDSAAHAGALKAKGRTIGVLACGIAVNYPIQSHDLKVAMVKNNGALISELPPYTKTNAQYFRIRNRLIAGLSLGVLLTHTPMISGSLLTAEHALEQGKEVYCVPPCDITSREFMGVMRYIRDGSSVVSCAEDILMDFYVQYAHKLKKSEIISDYILNAEAVSNDIVKNKKKKIIKKEKVKTEEKNSKDDTKAEDIKQTKDNDEKKKEKLKLISSLDQTQMKIYNSIDIATKTVEEISVDTKLDIGTVASVLMELEIMGVASCVGGSRYKLN